MTACARHAETPAKGYSECPGCEVEMLRKAALPLPELIERAERAAKAADTEADTERDLGGNAVKEAVERGRAMAFRQVAGWLRRLSA